MKPNEGRSRVVIEQLSPAVDGGRYPVARIVGDSVRVQAAIFADGHDHVAARLLYRPATERRWRTAPMRELSNDLWEGSFVVDQLGQWQFTLEGWIDHLDTWASDLKKRIAAQTQPEESDSPAPDPASLNAVAPASAEAGSPGLASGTGDSKSSHSTSSSSASQDVALAFRSGALLFASAAKRARGADARKLTDFAQTLESLAAENRSNYEDPLTTEIVEIAARYPDLTFATRASHEIPIRVDRERARFSAWYELFPRSTSSVPGQHGTFADVERQLPEIAAMGFDILYLPPIHPIGRAYRKGPNNSTVSNEGDPGSPWAIGDSSLAADPKIKHSLKEDDGGHKSILPQLGTYADFDHLVAATKNHGMELALDIAFQCSPDHPWVTKHPDWFMIRPDGSIQYAENPPKKYQDIYPLNFESPDWRSLWDELYSVFEFWIKRGVKVFRVDNPHTKALPFWEWCLTELQKHYPDTIFLAEAFTRPHVMYSLAKGGFTHSYTYFTWRNTKAELEEYLEEITQPPVSDFFKPNFWPNTPDILHKSLQDGGRPAFMQRLILAATLTANYGIYGPAYELGENAPAKPAAGKTESEEYLDSEKYEIRQRDRNQPGTLVPLITQLNQIRRANPALQQNETIVFHPTDNEKLICYSKTAKSTSSDQHNVILVALNLDPVNEQAGWVHLDTAKLGLNDQDAFIVEDLLTGIQYTWHGANNYVALKPQTQPAHIFLVHKSSTM